MKRIVALLLAVLMVVTLFAGCDSTKEPKDEGSPAPTEEKSLFGVDVCAFSDTHSVAVRTVIEKENAKNGDLFEIQATDAQMDIGTEWNNINNLVTKGAETVAVAYLNYENYPQLINLFKDNDCNLIAYKSNPPTDEECEMYDKFYFVSTKAENSGEIQGQIVVDYWNAHPEADRNGNGKLDYVMLMGTLGFYDTIMRTEYSVKAVVDAGIEVNEIISVAADYERAKAQDAMASIISANADDIDVIFANNDEMALGAIESLKAAGFFKDESTYIPVVGVDATVVGVEAIKEGTLLGSALNDPVILGQCIYQVAEWLHEGKYDITQEMLDEAGFSECKIDDHRRIYVNYKPITIDNTEDADYNSKY